MKHVARKRFGQHFLTDRSVVGRIVAAIAPGCDDNMVEIGPGLGALTYPLLQHLGRLHVVEIDRDIVTRLRTGPTADRLVIHEGDVLAFDFGLLGDAVRIVGNLPYNISTPILFHLSGLAERVRDAHFMLQKEVVERMVAQPGGREYGRLSVMLQYRFRMERLFTVPPQAFRPPPKVESAVIRMMPRAGVELTARDDALLSLIVRTAFSQRRKMLRNTLHALIDEAKLAALDIAPTRRPEELCVADYVRICNALTGTST